jgi:hypothetical protein
MLHNPADFGTSEEAKAMLEKAVATVKENKAKALDMFNRARAALRTVISMSTTPPREVPSEILTLYHREKNPLKALKARCLDFCCGVASEVRKCTAVACPSWPFRLGVNPLRSKRIPRTA